ncbi:MAG: BREX-6 system adenine-specific DNA-methyltransferase PglX, partial [Leptolyngbya sp.]|nr:BREX-6 system adenine-specific DNA-methyltransferase PglX [Leptolyngbya sp.]
MPYLTPDAKNQLSRTIRALRGRLLTDLHNAAESTYRLSIAALDRAGLAEEQREKRRRLETWLDEQVRAEVAPLALSGTKLEKAKAEIRARSLHNALKLAAATLLNRLIVIRQMEALGLLRTKVVTGGWSSPAYREFRDFAPDLCKDDTEGYGFLLQLLYDELALDLPGLFGRVGLTELFPIPASTLRAVIEALDALDPDTWRDDTTLGWVYQYWNDPEREALDDKLNSGGKVAPHEIASKTQMFTERYMVEWLLHNSLGQQWLAICQQNGWTAEAVADGTLETLEKRRQDWREQRERGEVALDALMPIETEQEERWKYWVKQPPLTPLSRSGRGAGGEGELLSGGAFPHPLTPSPKGGEGGPEGLTSIRHLKLLDPACGSGHFLIIAFDLLFAFYQEEARHRGETWSDREIVESILAYNLHGLDLDPRAVQIAAAALYLKAKALCPQAELTVLNLVAANLNLAALPEDDPALVELRQAVTASTGIPEALTNQIVQGLKGADTWGTLLKVDDEVDRAIASYEWQQWKQGELFAAESPLTSPLAPLHGMERGTGDVEAQGEEQVSSSTSPSPLVERGPGGEVKAILIAKLERFLTLRTRGDDLGLRLRGEQLAAGVRFLRLVREGAYDLVIGNPPYQGTSKMKDAQYVAKHYPKAKADLYAAFLQRGLELAKPGGLSALLTMRNWMFISQYSAIREFLIDTYDLRALGDFDRGAFDEVPNEVLSVVASIFCKAEPTEVPSIATQPTPFDDLSYDRQRTNRKRAAVLAQVGRYEFQTQEFEVIKEKPLVYWWENNFLESYARTPKLYEEMETRVGLRTSDNTRFLRKPWEIRKSDLFLQKVAANSVKLRLSSISWVPYIKGAFGKAWFEPLDEIVTWEFNALEICVTLQAKYGAYPQSREFYFSGGVAFTSTGGNFAARLHRFRSAFDVKGQSVFPKDPNNVLCLMNSRIARDILSSLNPTISFQVGDADRLPLFPIESADEIFAQLDHAFTAHEAARETSVEFQHPGPSCWAYAQTWAQQAVDRPPGAPLPPWQPQYDPVPSTHWVSYAVGLALGRFGPHPLTPSPQGEGEQELSELPSPLGRGAGGEGEPLPRETHPHPLTPSPQGEGGQEHVPAPLSPGRGAGGESLPHGILYLSAYSGDHPNGDSLHHPACQSLHTAWADHGRAIAPGKTLRHWLRLNFFKDVHLGMYEQRPIYFPLSSEKKNFVALVSIHRWQDSTLTDLLADYLIP